MSGTAWHTLFDIAAWIAAAAAGFWVSRVKNVRFPASSFALPYLAALVFGAGIGAYMFGTLNLWCSGQSGIARSVEGAIAGGVLAVEVYKWMAGIKTRTGARFALPLAIGIAVGRIGCYGAGLDDFTYGTPTSLPWGHDFGDGIARHPVQIYESVAMFGFAVFYGFAVTAKNGFVVRNGFYLAVAFYALQRFVWEFFKPYGPVFGPLSIFHLLSIAIAAYAIVMIATDPSSELTHEHAVA